MVDYAHTIKIPESARYQHGVSPVLQDLSKQTGQPTSELMAKRVQAQNVVHRKIIEDPTLIVPDEEDGLKMLNQMIWDTALNLILTGKSGLASDEIDDALTNEDGQSILANMFSVDEDENTESTINDPQSVGFSDSDMSMFNEMPDDDILGSPDDFQTDTYGEATDENANAGSVNGTDVDINQMLDGTVAETGAPSEPKEEDVTANLGDAYTQVN